MKIALMIALICLILGVLVMGIGWVILQKNPIDKNVFEDRVHSYSIDALPSQINIESINNRVEFRITEEDEWRVECRDQEKVYHTVELVDGVLTIKEIDERRWYEWIGIFTQLRPTTIIVYLPAGSYDTLDIRSTSSDIVVPEGFTFSDVTLHNTSGDISFASAATGAMSVKNTSGDIRITGGVNGNLNVTNGSGCIEIKDATPLAAKIQNTSGIICLQNVVCQEACEIKNTSSRIELERCDAASFDIQNTSGDIRGSILSGKMFDCHATSGSVRVPDNAAGGTFKAKTTSGSIKITIVE